MKKTLVIAFVLIAAIAKLSAQSENYKLNWDELSQKYNYNAEPDWMKDAKFGIYFHWGVYSVPAFSYEWYPRHMFMPSRKEYKFHKEKYGDPKEFGYDKLIPLFTAEKFDAVDLVETFQRAGAKFAGHVAIHHDGFAMWDSKITPWNAKLMGPKRDILGEMSAEIKKRNMKLITTFHHERSIQLYRDNKNQDPGFWDMYNSHFPWIEGMPTTSDNPMLRLLYGNVTPEEFYDPIWFGELKEVIDNYSPDIIYFDSWLENIPEEYLYKYVEYYISEGKKKGKQVVTSRKQKDLPLNISIEDLEKSRKQVIEPHMWLTDETITTDSWSYTDDMVLKTAPTIINVLIDVVSKNGVLMLNVSPRADGVLPIEQKEILYKIGDWLDINGEAIYGTRPWYTFGEGPTTQPEGDFENHKKFLEVRYSWKDVRYTQKANAIYATLLGTPQNGTNITFKSFAKSSMPKNISVKNVSVFGTNEKISWQQNSDGLKVIVPRMSNSNETAMVFKVEY